MLRAPGPRPCHAGPAADRAPARCGRGTCTLPTSRPPPELGLQTQTPPFTTRAQGLQDGKPPTTTRPVATPQTWGPNSPQPPGSPRPPLQRGAGLPAS